VIVVDENKLSAVLSEFARTLNTDFSILEILGQFVERIVELLPITSAGVTLISDALTPHEIAASDESALRFERLQTELGHGPCLSAFATGRAVSVPDLRNDHLFPEFGPAAVAAGLAAVFAFPLHDGDGRFGAMDLYRDTPGALDSDDLATAQTLADVATAYLLNAQARGDARRASSELAVERSRLQSLLDTVPGGIALTDADGKYLFVNDGAAPLLDHVAGDALSAPATDPLLSALWRDGRQRVAEDLPMVRAAHGEVVRQDVIGLMGLDRSVRWLIVNATPNHDETGAVAGAVAAFQDITEMVELQRRVEASEGRLNASQRVAGVGTWERDLRSGELSWSAETFRLYGVDGSEPSTFEDGLELVHPDDRKKVRNAEAESMRTGRPLSVRHRIVRSDGAVRVMAQRAEVVLGSAGQPIKLLGTVHDVTDADAEHDRNQQMLQVESMGRLAGGLAHDLNNLLTVIGGHSGLLAIDADERRLESTKAIDQAVDRAAALMRQLLAVGRREVLQPTSIDVNRLLRTEKINLRRVLPGGIEIEYALADGLPNGFFDAAKLERVLLNIILNARDALGDQGHVKIETALRDLDDTYAATHAEVTPGRYVCITVSDDGIGMSPDVLSRALEPFYSTKPREKGTGLGLSTSAGVLSQAGGHLALRSQEGRGAVVEIFVPVTHEEASPQDEPKLWPRIPGRGTVLVAEDDDHVRELIVITLESSGYSVLAGVDGIDALAAASGYSGQIDILITDVSMPGLGGRQLAESLAETRPDMQILYISGYTEDSDVLRGIVRNDINFLAKPFSMKELLTSVHTLIGPD
jgi:two-component system, cell cycle sensor histidine kinase and response regulator CckA